MGARICWLAAILVTVILLTFIEYTGHADIGSGYHFIVPSHRSHTQEPRKNHANTIGSATIAYTDPPSGFEARVPQGWRRIVQTQPGDIGFTVSFESPASSKTDVFAEYLMVDIQPHRIEQVFTHSPDERASIQVNGSTVYRERIALDNYPVADTSLDLVVWQFVIEDALHSVAVYAVGEKHEAAKLEKILVDFANSFDLPQSPFLLSIRTGINNRFKGAFLRIPV